MVEKTIDLRSDTVTLPKPDMLEAIMSASLGDDVMGEDQTVLELERRVAELLGTEDAMLVISGTMANQLAIMTFANRGEEVIVGEETHIYNLERAAIAAISQVQARPIQVKNGYFDPEVVEAAISTGDIQRPRTALICIENTYNLNRGQIVTVENMRGIRDVTDQHGLPIFLDGARMFNAAVELGVQPRDLCKHVDAVQFCLTKGLGCPLGSILAGTREFIREAKFNRQRIGGGMRQAGIIAAPGLYALDHMVDRLKEDNDGAKNLAKQLSDIKGLHINLDEVQTNIVSPHITKDGWNADMLIEQLLDKGIKVKWIGKNEVRMIIHYQITDQDIEYIVSSFERILSSE